MRPGERGRVVSQLARTRQSSHGRPNGIGGWWNIRYLARAAPKLDAKLTLELHRFLQRFVVVARHDRVHSNRKSVQTNYEGPVRVRL
jgi:hypothetical protein